MLSFWLSIHLLKLDEARLLYDLDPLMGKVVSNLLTHGKALLLRKKVRDRLKIQNSLMFVTGNVRRVAPKVDEAIGSERDNLASPPDDLNSNETPFKRDEYEGIEIGDDDGEDVEMGRDKKRYKNLLTDKIGKQTKLNPKITKEVANNIKSLDELKDIKYLLSKRVGAPFCTNVLRVALNFSEEKVAR